LEIEDLPDPFSPKMIAETGCCPDNGMKDASTSPGIPKS